MCVCARVLCVLYAHYRNARAAPYHRMMNSTIYVSTFCSLRSNTVRQMRVVVFLRLHVNSAPKLSILY